MIWNFIFFRWVRTFVKKKGTELLSNSLRDIYFIDKKIVSDECVGEWLRAVRAFTNNNVSP